MQIEGTTWNKTRVWLPAEDGEVLDWTRTYPMIEKLAADWRER